LDNERWVTGFPVVYPDGSASMFSRDSWESFGVKPETIRQFTGLVNPMKQRLYDGDVVVAFRRDDNLKVDPVMGEVSFLNGCFMVLNCTLHELFKLYQSDWRVMDEQEAAEYRRKAEISYQKKVSNLANMTGFSDGFVKVV